MKKGLIYIKYILISFISGITGIVPGMSGGTIFAIFGVSEDLVTSITKILTFKIANIKKYIALPIILGGGSLLSSILYSKIFSAYMDSLIYFFEFIFIGLIIFSMPLLLKETKEQKNKTKVALFFLGGFVFALGLYLLSNSLTIKADVNYNSPLYLFKYGLISIINGMTMILPGISGTNVLLIFGEYENYIMFTSHFMEYLLQNIIFLLCVIVGNISSAYILNYIFNNFKANFFAIISGMTFSTIFVLYSNPFVSLESIVQASIGFLLGTLLMLITKKYTK